MTNAKRASMREGPLSALFRKSAEESAAPRKGEEDGEGAARGEPLGVRTVVKIARDIASPPPRRNRRHRLLKNAPSIKGSNQHRSRAAP